MSSSLVLVSFGRSSERGLDSVLMRPRPQVLDARAQISNGNRITRMVYVSSTNTSNHQSRVTTHRVAHTCNPFTPPRHHQPQIVFSSNLCDTSITMGHRAHLMNCVLCSSVVTYPASRATTRRHALLPKMTSDGQRQQFQRCDKEYDLSHEHVDGVGKHVRRRSGQIEDCIEW